MRIILFLMMLLPSALTAQTLRDRFDAGTSISAEEWQKLTDGRTVVYQSYGIEHGREYYPVDSNKVFYRFANGKCIEGTVSYEPEQFCFAWQGLETMCFQHKYVDGEIFIASEDGMIFVSAIVANDPFRCTPGLMSALDLPLSFVSLK